MQHKTPMTNTQTYLSGQYHSLASRERELARVKEMVQQMTDSMQDTGFAAQDVALVLMQVGMALAADICEREGDDAPDFTQMLHRTATGLES